LQAGYITTSGWTVNAFVRNLENKATVNTISNGYAALPSYAQAIADLDPPRVFGLSLRKDF
jgi:iron complex outermembrane recepter protein